MSATGARVLVGGHEAHELVDSWEAASTTPDPQLAPAPRADLDWVPASVPGTAAATLAALGRWQPGDRHDFDTEDWWFRTSFDASPPEGDEQAVLRLGGLATVAEAYLNGELVLRSDSMFAAHELDVGARLRGANELVIRFRALSPLLRVRRRPRARWRTRVVADGGLRFFRTTMLGRAPGWAPAPAPVGPWRPIVLERRRRVSVDELALLPGISGADGRLELRARVRSLGAGRLRGAELILSGDSGTHTASLELGTAIDGTTTLRGVLSVPRVARWWPHTHGEPTLHRVELVLQSEAEAITVDCGRVGFRTLAPGPDAGHDVEADGLALHVNGVPIFCRGAIWTPTDPVGLAPDALALRASIESVREAGMNMIRLPGTGLYESERFFDLVDELGVLVWQDFMFANLDYPFADGDFHALVVREARQVLAGLRGRPSLAVLCGNSEIEQQVSMLGLDPSLGRGEMFGHTLPALAQEMGSDAIYVPSSPCGGELPFRVEAGVAHYFGVGAYLRPLADARRAEVRFASECLAISNVPNEAGIAAVIPDQPGALAVHDPRWKAGVPRDVGPGWDFEDVRDHYLALLFGVDPVALRSVDHARYLELSRAVSGEVMAEVFGEWRRSGSPCGGGLVLWWRDLAPGAGWGIIDQGGEPKVVFHHLRRVLAPIAVWTTDEGLGGIAVHVANDRPQALRARLEVRCYRDLEACVGHAHEALEVPPHGVQRRTVEGLLGHFVDASWAYRFGPPAQDAIVVSLTLASEPTRVISQATRFPAGYPLEREPLTRIGLEASARPAAAGTTELTLRCRRLAYGVRVHAPGFVASDDAFSLEPAVERTVRLVPGTAGGEFAGASLSALNLQGEVRVRAPES